LGNKESCRCWLGMLRDLVRRGLRPPVSITSDGGPGLLRNDHGDLAQEPADSLLGASDAECPGQGSRRGAG
jgi:hypothetical protein